MIRSSGFHPAAGGRCFIAVPPLFPGTMRVFQEHGISIPEELSVIAIGNDPCVAELCRPRLTTMAVDCRRLGELGVNALLEIMRTPGTAGKTTLLSMTLHEHDSVATRTVES